MKIALLPGGFKPPHLGHYNMAKYLADFADKVIVRIGQKERDGIGAPLALEVWSFYKEFDPDPRAKKLIISVAQSPSPVKDVYDFVEKIAPEGSTVILGMGEKDAADGRYNSIPKFAEPRNIKAEIELVPPQAGGISGTRMREIIKANDKDTFFKYIPEFLPEEIKEEIWTKLVDTTMPSDIDEMMGGTMNKQEMTKHLSNMVKLRKSFKKQGDQMIPVPTNLTKGLRRKLYEAVTDELIKKIIFELTNIIKNKQTGVIYLPEEMPDKFSKYIDPDNPLEFTWKGIPSFSIEFNFNINPKAQDLYLIDSSLDTSDGNNTILIDLTLAADFKSGLYDIVGDLNDNIAHEIEHIYQKAGFRPGMEDLKSPKFKDKRYYMDPLEIPAEIKGFKRLNKLRNEPIEKTIRDWFNRNKNVHNLSDSDIDELVIFLTKKYNEYYNIKENFPPYKANQVQQTRYKASDTFTNDRKKAKKLGYLEEINREELKKGIEVEKEHTDDPRIAMKIALDHLAEDPKYYTKLATLGLEEMKLFSKEWWLDVITEELLNEGGAAGHMAHPFDLDNVKTGKDLIRSFEQAAESLKNQPGSVKIDGVNASIRLINNAGKREFAMDRGSKKALDLKGVTKADLEARFGPGHGMIKAGGDVLDIFNDALPTIQEELEALGMWDNPNIMFNMEYVSGKSNVQDYGKNFLAIHGLLEVETKEVEGARGKMLVKRVTSEKNFAQSDMDELLRKLEPFAKKKGFEIYGSVPTTFTKEPNFKAELGKNYTIDFAEGSKTKSLAQWLNDVTNIPKTDRLKMNIEETDSIKDVGALSKQVYFAVFGGENVDSLFSTEQEVQKAIQGATTYLATEKLGDAILDVLDSPMGSVNDHEGVVIRDPKISNRPFKVTGKFITGGVSSQFQTK